MTIGFFMFSGSSEPCHGRSKLFVEASPCSLTIISFSSYIMRGSQILACNCTIASRRGVAPTNDYYIKKAPIKIDRGQGGAVKSLY
jgi:hypothetical protein